MIRKIKKSLSRINYGLFLALIVLALAPTIYTTVRVFFLFGDTKASTTEYSYLQDETNGERFGNYYFVSYNDIVKTN